MCCFLSTSTPTYIIPALIYIHIYPPPPCPSPGIPQVPAGSLQDMSIYFSSCHGADKVGNLVAAARTSAAALSAALRALATDASSAGCLGDPSVLDMQVPVRTVGAVHLVVSPCQCLRVVLVGNICG